VWRRLREDRRVPLSPASVRPLGLALGVLADAVFADPRRGHPVAGFGRAAAALEARLYADDVRRGAAFAGIAVAGPVVAGAVVQRVARRRPLLGTLATAAATWAVLGGTSLAREGQAMASSLEAGDLSEARHRLRNLCARQAGGLGSAELARATVESLAENTSDAVVAPLVWGAVAGVPGLLGYRAVNTLDAMVGYTSPRYLRFGRVPARLDDLANLLPARLTAGLTVLAAPAVGGHPTAAWRVLRRDGGRHPSPNAGRAEAAAAGALGLRLGGANQYHGTVERRPEIGDGAAPDIPDLRRAVRLGRVVGGLAAVVCVCASAGLTRRRGAGGRGVRGRGSGGRGVGGRGVGGRGAGGRGSGDRGVGGRGAGGRGAGGRGVGRRGSGRPG
jgi:adenosylcobinamide-phosphate synthase